MSDDINLKLRPYVADPVFIHPGFEIDLTFNIENVGKIALAQYKASLPCSWK